MDPPFVPQLFGDLDTTYFDDFTKEEDLAAYREIQAKFQMQQTNVQPTDEEFVEKMPPRSAFVGFTFRHKEARNYYHALKQQKQQKSVIEDGSFHASGTNGYGELIFYKYVY